MRCLRSSTKLWPLQSVEAEPKARRITLSAATIHDQAELDAWLDKSKTAIAAALKDGPVIL